MKIIVTGYIVRRPVGGLAWHYLHYVLGLAELGHDVCYLEDSEDFPSCFDPEKVKPNIKSSADEVRQPFEQLGKDPRYGIQFITSIFEHLGMAKRWAYFDAHKQEWLGPVSNSILQTCRDADVLLNISHSVPIRPWLADIPSRVLVDTDPVFGQSRHIHIPGWLDRALQHNVFVTFGENYGQKSCSTPVDGLPWKSTRQPIVLHHWPVQDAPREIKFTTVMSWRSYDPAKNAGTEYGLKSDSFTPYVDLPFKTEIPLELALDSSPELQQMLIEKGWGILNAIEVTRDPWSYQNYIQSSAAEFSVAKQAYVMTNSGWFSERSAAYLASGRPVLTQETGFSDWLTTEAGVVPFSSPEQAIAGAERIIRDYNQHWKAARQVAEEFFDHRAVLSRLLDLSLSPASQGELESKTTGSAVIQDFRHAVAVINETIPPGLAFILIDDTQWGVSGYIAGHKCYPFLEKNGLHWGNPADDQVAIEELERLRRIGVGFVVFARAAFWWRDHYRGFYDYLATRYTLLRNDHNLIIFDIN